MRWAAGLFLLFLAFSPGRLLSFDVATRASVSRALWTEGTPFVAPGSPSEDGLVFPPGSSTGTTFYGIGQSLVLIPFDILGALLEKAAPTPPVAGQLRQLPIVLLYTPLAGIAWWASLALLLEVLGLARTTARAGAALFSVTTIFFVYASQTAQEEALVGALVTAALAFWIRSFDGTQAQSRGPRDPALAGLLAGCALCVRLNSALSLLPLVGALIEGWRRSPGRVPRLIGAGLAGAALPVTCVLLFAYLRFGSPFATGYDLAAKQGMGVFFTRFQPDVFLGLLVGFGKGLFILSPPLFLAALGWGRAWKNHPLVGHGVWLSLLAGVTLCAFIFNNPDGSECWGARYQVHLLGFFALPVLLGWQRLFESWRVLAWSVAALGFAFQVVASVGPDAVEYTQSDREGAPRTQLITGISTGHLGRRLSNAAAWASGTRLREPAAISKMTDFYLPNIWAFAWPRKIAPQLSWLLVPLWALCLGTGVFLFTRGIAWRKGPCPGSLRA